jgi:hypothetical protein
LEIRALQNTEKGEERELPPYFAKATKTTNAMTMHDKPTTPAASTRRLLLAMVALFMAWPTTVAVFSFYMDWLVGGLARPADPASCKRRVG